MKMILAQKVSYDYVLRDEDDNVQSARRALDSFDTEIEGGSFVCILGHNGSGKSTFARLVNGLNLPTEGTVLVAGLDTKNEEDLLEIRKTAGMVFQNPDNQIIANVVEEDVGFGPENIGIPTEEILKRVDTALREVSMQEFRDRSPNRLSGGQKQRVAIAGVMAMKPRCIILDEPTAMLDPEGRREVLETVHRLNRTEGITIILITHNMEEAVDADRILVLHQGKLAMDGTPREIFSRAEELKRLSLCVPEMTELAEELRKSGLPLPEGILTETELTAELLKLKKTAESDREEQKIQTEAADKSCK